MTRPEGTVTAGDVSVWWSEVMKCFPEHRLTTYVEHHTVVIMSPVEVVYPRMMLLRDHPSMQFKVLVDMTAVDYPSRSVDGPRFDVVYQRLSVQYGVRCMVKVSVDEMTMVPSMTSRFMSANWAERECFDMFGIMFEGHPDLRRILTDYGFEGYPMRKDFPLMGFMEVRYDEFEKRVVSEPLQLSQDLRTYHFVNPWKVVPSAGVVKAA